MNIQTKERRTTELWRFLTEKGVSSLNAIIFEEYQRVSTSRHRHTMGFRLVRKGQRMLDISETVARCYELYIYILYI